VVLGATVICEKCAPRELKAMRALESLTPSGSEFVNDPEFCAAFVRASRESQMRVIVKLTQRLHAVERERDELKNELEDIIAGEDI
jgi:hypothetical protein